MEVPETGTGFWGNIALNNGVINATCFVTVMVTWAPRTRLAGMMSVSEGEVAAAFYNAP